MARCDFSSIIKIISSYIKEGNRVSQPKLICELFYSFSDDNEDFEFDNAQINRWIKGTVPVSPAISKYYQHSDGAEKLCLDIESCVFPLLYDIDMAVQEIHNLVLNDVSISDTKRNALLKKYSDDNAAFAADVIIFALIRTFKKKELVLKMGILSPVVNERIIDGEAPDPCKFFCGRDNELEQFHSLLSAHSKIFVTGIAGIGKSEFVKAYAKRCKSEYTNILYYQYNGSLQRLITEIEFTDDLPEEDAETKFKKHNRFLRALKDDSLLIIDNFNTTESDEQLLGVILKYNCRVIFTTRSKFECGTAFELSEISDTDTLIDLFGKFYSDTEHCRETVSGIIETVYHHTFIVELAARHLQKGIVEPDELLSKLKENSVNPHTADKIKISKDGLNLKDTYYNHLHTLFSLFLLNEQMQMIMRCMVLVPKEGIVSKTLAKWCALHELNEINDLVELGYMIEDDIRTIKLLPIIRDIVLEDLKPSCISCADFLRSIFTICLQIGIDRSSKEAIFDVIENIMKYVVIDSVADYLLFLQNAFSFMEKYEYERGMRLIIIKMEYILNYIVIGSNIARALLYNSQASCERLFSKNNVKALELCRKALDLCDPEIDLLLAANVNMNIGVLLDELGEVKAAENSMERAIEYARKANVINNNTVIMSRNYARILSKSGKTERAKTNLRNTIGEMKANGFDKTIDYADLNLELGYINIKQKHTEEADVCFIRAFRIYSEKLDRDKLEKLALSVQGFYKAVGVKEIPNCLVIKSSSDIS